MLEPVCLTRAMQLREEAWRWRVWCGGREVGIQWKVMEEVADGASSRRRGVTKSQEVRSFLECRNFIGTSSFSYEKTHETEKILTFQREA